MVGAVSDRADNILHVDVWFPFSWINKYLREEWLGYKLILNFLRTVKLYQINDLIPTFIASV